MKILVRDLKPNPFRNVAKYPINRTKVESLIASINQTGFWDNVLARAATDGKYEIAYGHHRLHAIKEVGIKEVDIPVRELDDETMIKIMANENMEDWELDTKVLDETVKVVMEFLEVRRKEDATAEKVQKFLGKNWPLRRVQDAMANLNGAYDQEAIESFKAPTHARTFRESIVQHANAGMEIDKPTQRQIAKELIEEVSQEDEPELTSAKIREKVYKKAGEKAAKSHKGKRTALVLDAIFVQIMADLGRISQIANDIRFTVVDVDEPNRAKVEKKVDEIIHKLERIVK